MAILTSDQISNIIKNNPNKKLIEAARDYSNKLMLHVLGCGVNSALTQDPYFESPDVFNARTKNATSNKDMFSRVLHREEMVFSAKGGAAVYPGLSEDQTIQFDAKLDKIRFNFTIRKWVKEFALQAYRVDPMGVLFVEVDEYKNIYPTYKSSDCIYDYNPNGRQLDYICFRLKVIEAKQYADAAGLTTTSAEYSVTPDAYSPIFFRLIDDAMDRLIKFDGALLTILDEQPLFIDEVPGIRASDLIDFSDNRKLLSPLDKTLELANSFLVDRSVRDLSKKYSGFPKGYEPLLTCGICKGTGMLSAKACPECTPAGSDRGTGFKLRTKVADIARFPLPKEGQAGGITDPSRFFGYITPSIETWDKQDTSLNDIEAAINDTYWGTTNRQSTTGPTTSDKHAFQETATKTLADLQPVYARLNATADWAEATENALCEFIGEYMFPGTFKESSRTYGRYYILETPDELIEQYLDMKAKGASQTALFDTLRKYYHALYANDPVQLAINVKLVDVEPFVHFDVSEVLAFNPGRLDYFCKLYYSEWLATKTDGYLMTTKAEALISDLQAYAKIKMVQPAELVTPPTPAIGITERTV